MNDKVKMLEEFRDKCYISNQLCQITSEFYGRIKSIISIPLILSSSIMTILNSSTDIPADHLKYSNIVLNASTAIILSMMGNFKINEKQALFRTIGQKFIKLLHSIEDTLTYDTKDINKELIKTYVKEYDALNEMLEYPFPEHIKRKVRLSYKGKRTLPNILNCETEFSSRKTYDFKNLSLDTGSETPVKSSVIFDVLKRSKSTSNVPVVIKPIGVVKDVIHNSIDEKIEGLQECV